MQFSFEQEIVVDILNNILWLLEQIKKRFSQIKMREDFLKDDKGLEKLDSICMQLINIVEALKQIDKVTESKLLVNYASVDWKRAKGMRDIITHHYFDVDAEINYSVCSHQLPAMETVVRQVLTDLNQGR